MASPRRRAQYRRWRHPFRDHPGLKGSFDTAVLEIGRQVSAHQTRRQFTQRQLVEAANPHLSDRGLRAILKAESDPKVSTLVRLAAALDGPIMIVVRPPTGAALP